MWGGGRPDGRGRVMHTKDLNVLTHDLFFLHSWINVFYFVQSLFRLSYNLFQYCTMYAAINFYYFYRSH